MIASSKKKQKALNGRIQDLNKLVSSQKGSVTDLENELKLIGFEREELESLRSQSQFIGEVLTAEVEDNTELNEFLHLYNGPYMEFINKEASLADEAEMLIKMQEIVEYLRVLVGFPEVYSKNILAISGGFSSGKSEFVNSMSNNEDTALPVDISPSTAIPTYIVAHERGAIYGFSKNGGRIELDLQFYKRMSHKFVSMFPFNVKDIMPCMAVGTQFIQDVHENICYIDTPGYNPPRTAGVYTAQDYNTAKEYLDRSHSLIWMIGLDACHGHIPNSDLEFLEDLNLGDKSLYVIGNKAELKSEQELEDICNQFEETLDDNSIDYEGISMYSAIKKKEYCYRVLSLFDFLRSKNNPVEQSQSIKNDVRFIFKKYENAIKSDISECGGWLHELRKIETEFSKYLDDIPESDLQMITNLRGNLKKQTISKYEEHLNELYIIRDDMIRSITGIFRNLEH